MKFYPKHPLPIMSSSNDIKNVRARDRGKKMIENVVFWAEKVKNNDPSDKEALKRKFIRLAHALKALKKTNFVSECLKLEGKKQEAISFGGSVYSEYLLKTI